MTAPRKSVPHPVDCAVGARLRLQRQRLGLSQTSLGERVGLTFQQIQKYERGTNRVSASKLFEFAKFLSIDVAFFYADLSDDGSLRHSTAEMAVILDPLTQQLAAAFERLSDPGIRRCVALLVAAIAEAYDA